jgi:hypothetical protein
MQSLAKFTACYIMRRCCPVQIYRTCGGRDFFLHFLHPCLVDTFTPNYTASKPTRPSFYLDFIHRKCLKIWPNRLSPSGGFGGLRVSVLASGTQVRGFKPSRSRRIFKGGKVLSTPSFGREVKPWVPCRKIRVPWKSASRQNYRSFSAHKFQLPPLECGTRR